MFKASEWDFICTKLKNKELYDLMIYDPIHKELFFEESVTKDFIEGVDSYGNPYVAAELRNDIFYLFYNKLFRDLGCSMGFFDYENEPESKEKATKKPLISKETIFKAIRGELNENELFAIKQEDMESADYYDYDAFMSMIQKYMRGEVSATYYSHWAVIVCWALGESASKARLKRSLIYDSISNEFDGHAFEDFENMEEGIECCKCLIASLKHKNHLLSNIGRARPLPFYNEDKVLVYMIFDKFNHYNEFNKICVVDEVNKVFTIKDVINPVYLENVNYTFLDRDEFDDLTSEYYEYFLDINMSVSNYIYEKPFLDVNGKEVK